MTKGQNDGEARRRSDLRTLRAFRAASISRFSFRNRLRIDEWLLTSRIILNWPALFESLDALTSATLAKQPTGNACNAGCGTSVPAH